MSAESVVTMLGLGDLLGRDLLAVQIIVLGATAGLLVLSMAMMIMAARSAGGARRARLEAEAQMRSAQDLVVEARQISVQIDRGEAKRSAASDHPKRPIRVSARETTPEAEVEIISGKHRCGADSSAERDLKSRNLDVATEAATVPKGLLGLRRRGRD